MPLLIIFCHKKLIHSLLKWNKVTENLIHISLLQIKNASPETSEEKASEENQCRAMDVPQKNVIYVTKLKFKMGLATMWPTMGRLTNRDLLVVVLFLCRTIVCDSQCPKFAEKPLETRVQDASIVFRAVVVQTHYQVSYCYLSILCVMKLRSFQFVYLNGLISWTEPTEFCI